MFSLRSARGRAILAGVVLVAVLAGIAAVAGWRAQDAQERDERLQHTSAAAFALEDARAQTFLAATWVATSAFAEDPAPLHDLYRQAALASRQHLDEARAELIAMGAKEQLAAVEDVGRQMDELEQEVDTLWAFSLAADRDARIETAQREMPRLWPLAMGVIGGLEQLANEHQSELAAERAAADSASATTLWLTVDLSALAFAVAAGVGVLVLSVVRPLAALRASARAIAAGDVEARAKVSGPEEVASLACDFNEMTDALLAKAKALQESEGRYRLLAENVTDVIWAMDLNLRLTYVSPSVTHLRGYTVQEAMAQTLKEYLTPTSLEVAKKVLAEERAIEESEGSDPGRSRTLELEQTCKDGSTVWTEVKVAFLRDEGKQVVGILGVGRDITERKRAEEALRESEQRFSRLSGATFEGLVIHERGRILDANPAFARMFGYELSEVIRMHALDFTAPESRDLLWQGILSRRKEPFEALGLRKDGSTLMCELRGRDIPYQERMVTVTAVRDVTERKKAEEALRESEARLRSLFEASPDAIILSDLNTNIIMVNHRAVRLLGYSNAEEVIGRNSLEFIAPEDRQRAAQNALRTLQTGAIQSVEYTILRKDDTSFPAELSASSIVDGQGRPQAFTGVVRDISERKRAEEALQKTREEIESRVERRMQEVNGYGLTFRELTVLHLVAAGESDKEIATVLGISPLTAHKHLANILDKMGAASRTEAGVRALKEGLLD
jgi:PAS domain S-box-containing protein